MSLISLEMCFMGWIYESVATFSSFLTLTLHEYGIPNLYVIDAILMSVVIPFTHLMNNEDTKEVILDENWYQGIKHMLGLRTNQEPQHVTPEPSQRTQENVCSLPSQNESAKRLITSVSCPQPYFLRPCTSLPNIVSSQTSMPTDKRKLARGRCYSFDDNPKDCPSLVLERPIYNQLLNRMENPNSKAKITNQENLYTQKGSTSSLSIVILE